MYIAVLHLLYPSLDGGHWQGRPKQVRGPMQDLGAGPLWAVLYDVIVFSQPCYDLFEKMAYRNIKKYGELLE